MARHLDKYLPNFERIVYEVIELGQQLSSTRLPNLDKLDEFYQTWRNPIGNRKSNGTGEFSLILKRVQTDLDTSRLLDDNGSLLLPRTIDWKMIFYDEFVRYADRFYPMKKSSSTIKRRTIGGERFAMNKWSSTKIAYFSLKNLFRRTINNEHEKQIEQLYQF
jgi:hypothetical protein